MAQPSMNETSDMGEVEPTMTADSEEQVPAGGYSAIADEILSTEKPGPSDDDSDAITAALVDKMKADPKFGYTPGASLEPLFTIARRMMWDWKDAKRAKERKASGADEYGNCCPETICD